MVNVVFMKHQKISLAVDLLLFTIIEDKLQLLLTKRKEEPFVDMLCLPGVAVFEEETLYDATNRCLVEKTGIKEKIYMEQLYTFGDDLNRDPRNRVVSVSYYALIPEVKLMAYIDNMSPDAHFYDVNKILAKKTKLAYDHREIIRLARERLKGKADYTSIGVSLCDDEFTLPDLQKVYEVLLDKNLYKANFRKAFADVVEETGNMRRDGAYRPSKLYRYIGDKDAHLHI